MSEIASVGIRIAITGTGAYLPERVLTNDDLSTMVDTSDEWIQARTGMRERRIAREDEATSDMGAVAATRALESAGVDAAEVDLIIVATCTPDMIFPSTACHIQELIGAKNAFCFDLSAACSGFLYGIETARGMITSGVYKTVLVIGAEKMSSITDWEDRGTCILFGDGAGAAVLQAGDEGHGIMSTVMGSDGSLGDLLKLPAGGSRTPASAQTVEDRLHFTKMGGNQVFKHAVLCMSEAGQKALDLAGLEIADVDWVIPHQANMRIINAIAERAEVPLEKLCVNLERVGNLSGASVPVVLDEAVRDGRIKRGDIILFVVFGAGFTWGAMVLQW
ncbi:MAG: beta-ketoacyl-ACP synthase III [Kiritimatiellia bacterium]|jgi:3-oxoacyl-[acyl-carrier-protein] synthase-3|nr:beta-ketoacyl-ACP synthase III [Kiritimatiellia bacterium]MDP6848420.1 beta-ketoacyl-ACP synthase III [Kiritimatiellia bacterium]